MTHEFDAIIVGAGMGGLCAAAHLVAGGKRVAVVTSLSITTSATS